MRIVKFKGLKNDILYEYSFEIDDKYPINDVSNYIMMELQCWYDTEYSKRVTKIENELTEEKVKRIAEKYKGSYTVKKIFGDGKTE